MHNASYPVWNAKANRWIDQKTGKFAPRNTAPINISAQKQAGHIDGTPQYMNRVNQGKATSVFPDKLSADNLTAETLRTGKVVLGRPKLVRKTYPHPVGKGPNGGKQHTVTVHIDNKGKIHGHPSGPES